MPAAIVLDNDPLPVSWTVLLEKIRAMTSGQSRTRTPAKVVVVVMAWSSVSVELGWVLDDAGAGRDRPRLVPVQLYATQAAARLPPASVDRLVDLAWPRERAAIRLIARSDRAAVRCRVLTIDVSLRARVAIVATAE